MSTMGSTPTAIAAPYMSGSRALPMGATMNAAASAPANGADGGRSARRQMSAG